MASTSYTVTGVLYKKHPQEVKSEKFTVQNIIIKTVEEYPQYLQIQASNKAIAKLEGAKEGDSLKVDVNVQGRLWTGADGVEKCFNTLSLWNCEIVGSAPIETVKAEVLPSQELPDDLPF